jgi:signal recognition particle subunit SRP54
MEQVYRRSERPAREPPLGRTLAPVKSLIVTKNTKASPRGSGFAMFERLTDAFGSLYRRLSGQATISESNVRDAMGDVRTAMLDADVHLDAVNAFTDRVLASAVGKQVSKSLQPGQEMIGIVHEELVRFLGGKLAEPITGMPPGMPGMSAGMVLGHPKEDAIPRATPGPTVVMMCGLQGSGKTTTCGKLAAFLKKRGRSVMLVAADLQRPAAVEQLHTVAHQVERDLPGGAQVVFYSEPDKVAAYGQAVGVAVQVCQRAVEAARKQGIDTVILDTAGRLHVNDDLMGELMSVNRLVHPHQILLVVDAMTGQDAVNTAKTFNERLDFGGVVLTKMDGDTRGGAALSIKSVVNKPIKFVGTGEKMDAIDVFHPDRMADRILGMGDVVTLVERAQEQFSEEEAKKLTKKFSQNKFDFNDFLGQLQQIKKMGNMKDLMGMIPGVGKAIKDVDINDDAFKGIEAIIQSMTPAERGNPELINGSRRQRISKGSGREIQEVNKLMKQFEDMRKMMRMMGNKDQMRSMMKNMQNMPRPR